jgi:hypothetical protein
MSVTLHSSQAISSKISHFRSISKAQSVLITMDYEFVSINNHSDIAPMAYTGVNIRAIRASTTRALRGRAK